MTERIALTAIATLFGLAVMEAVHIAWMLNMIFQNVAAS